MSSGPLAVSVVIPALNEAAMVTRAVRRAWQAGAAEVLVVDGGSEDETPVLAERAGADVLHGECGRAVQQNLGARRARGDALLFLHADTWLPAGAIDQVAAALCDPSVRGGAFRQSIEAPGLLYRWLERGNAFRAERLGLPYGDQGIFMRRDVFWRLGGFPDVPLMEDLLLMKRFRRESRPVLLPGPLHVSARRWQRHGVLRQTVRNWTLLTAHRLGVSPNRLARFYPPHAGDAPSDEKTCSTS